MDVYHYDVTITPDVPPKLNKIVWEEFCTVHKTDVFNGMLTVYDGRKNLFAPKVLPCADPHSDRVSLGRILHTDGHRICEYGSN